MIIFTSEATSFTSPGSHRYSAGATRKTTRVDFVLEGDMQTGKLGDDVCLFANVLRWVMQRPRVIWSSCMRSERRWREHVPISSDVMRNFSEICSRLVNHLHHSHIELGWAYSDSAEIATLATTSIRCTADLVKQLCSGYIRIENSVKVVTWTTASMRCTLSRWSNRKVVIMPWSRGGSKRRWLAATSMLYVHYESEVCSGYGTLEWCCKYSVVIWGTTIVACVLHSQTMFEVDHHWNQFPRYVKVVTYCTTIIKCIGRWHMLKLRQMGMW